MKLIGLNTWAGHVYDPLMEFIEKEKADTDIFCFQEMCTSPSGPEISRGTHTRILEKISAALTGFQVRFTEADQGFDEVGPVSFPITWGQAMFIREGAQILEDGGAMIHPGDPEYRHEFDYRHVLQYARLKTREGTLTVCNVHATPRPGNKLDTPERIEQSERIRSLLKKMQGPIIVTGDFNLLPETKSIRILEEDLENLIKTHHITTTRGSLNPYLGTPQQQDFADYTFVSSEISVEEFIVPDAKISDHLPMILTFSLTKDLPVN